VQVVRFVFVAFKFIYKLKQVKWIVFGSTQHDMFIIWVMRVKLGQPNTACLLNGLCGLYRITHLFKCVILELEGLTCLTKLVVSELTIELTQHKPDTPTKIASPSNLSRVQG
jgi:hypothetical protein